MNNIFVCMNSQRIVDLIGDAKSRVVYINSGINEEIASALIIKSTTIGKENITVFTDFSEAVCQYGYGTALGYDHINDGGITVKKIENLRIGCLLVDSKGWIFTPTPLLLEADKVIDTQPNAIKVTPDQILALLNTTAANLMTPGEKQIIEPIKDTTEKLVGKEVSKDEIKQLTVKLEKNPPRKFDVSRKVNVFNTLIEFVELNLEGCSIGRKTVRIPSELVIGNIDKETRNQLKTGYKVVSSDSDFTGKDLYRQVDDIRKKHTRSILKFGRVILKSKRKDLENAVAKVRENIEKFQESLNTGLKDEIDGQKNNLIAALLPAILKKPPMDLASQIMGETPSDEQARIWLDGKLTNIFPTAENLINEMRLELIYKGVTYEILCEKSFQDKVQEQYNLLAWDRLFNEFEAIRLADD